MADRTHTDPLSAAAASRLLDHDAAATPANCLALAARHGREGLDEAVFLTAPAGAGGPGHVVLRDTASGGVREPGAALSAARSSEDYAAALGRRVLASAPVALLRDLLALAPASRSGALSGWAAPLAPAIGSSFGIAGPAPIPPKPKDQPPVGASATDKDVHAWLDALGGAASDGDKKDLARTGDDATTLLNWFDAHKRGDPDIDAKMPQNVRDAENRLLADDAVAKRIEVAGGADKGKVTRDALGSFVKDLDGAAKSAKDSWGSFQKDNKTPDPIAQQQAVEDSILQANLPVLDAAGGADAKVDGKVDIADLKAVASSSATLTVYVHGHPETHKVDDVEPAADAHLPAALAHAAADVVDSGQFKTLADAGLKADQTSDGTVNNDNFNAMLSSDTSKSEDDTISSLKTAASQKVADDAHGDASKVDASYYSDPAGSKASGADKLAALLQLSRTIGRYNEGEGEYLKPDITDLSSPDQYHQQWGDGPTPGEQRDAFIKDVQDRIGTLSQDKDVQSLLSDKMPGALQDVVNHDPGMKAAIQKQYDADSSTSALQAAFAKKDDKGNVVSTTDALSTFASRPNFYAQALGITPDYSEALAAAPQDIRDRVTQGYSDITSGKEVQDLTASGTPQDQAIVHATVDKIAYDSVLDKDTVAKGTDDFNESSTKVARAALTDGQSPDDMFKGLGVTGVGDPKLLQMLQEQTAAAPDADDKDKADMAKDALTIVRGISDAMRQGLKFDDAMAKVTKDMDAGSRWTASPGALPDAYKSGAFHYASGVLLAGVIAARVAGNGDPTPLSNAQTAGQIFSAAGLLTEGGGKFVNEAAASASAKVGQLQPTLSQAQASLDAARRDVDAATRAVTDADAQVKAALDVGDPNAPQRLADAQAAYNRAEGVLAQAQDRLKTDQSEFDSVKAQFDKADALKGSITNVGKDVETTGKAIGGVVGNVLGLVTGSIGAAQAEASGDKVGAGFQGLFAGLNGISAMGATGEIAAYVIPKVATMTGTALAEDAGAVAGAIAGVGGAIGAVAGGIAAIGGIIYAIIAMVKEAEKKQKSEETWYKDLQSGFASSGVALPDLATLVAPANGSVDMSNTPVSA